MLFNFIVTHEGETSIEDSHYTTIDAVSRDDAIPIFILNDSIETHYILTLIYNSKNFELDSDEQWKIARSLSDKFEGSTGLELRYIYDIEDEVYKQLLNDNLDEIAKLINTISGGGYFVILELSNILTGPTTKSARKI